MFFYFRLFKKNYPDKITIKRISNLSHPVNVQVSASAIICLVW